MGPSTIIQPQAGKAPSLPRTVPTLEPMHEFEQTSASPHPASFPRDVQTSAEPDTKSVPATFSRPLATSTTDSKADVTFNYTVILSRTPIYQWKSWKPKGHFLEKSLGELIDELPFDNKEDIPGLVIRLTGPGIATEVSIERDKDASYNSTKRRLMKTVKICLKNYAKANPGSILVMDFEMEALREGGVDVVSDDDDDLVF
jgi:hypothetical protein